MAKLDSTVIYGTLNVNGDTKVRQVEAKQITATEKIVCDKDAYIDLGPNTSWSEYLRIGGNGHSTSDKAVVCTTNGNLHMDAKTGRTVYLNHYAGTGVVFGNGNGSVVASMDTAGQLWKGGTLGTGGKYWHSENDGHGSGSDADVLDGLHGSQFLRSDAADTFTGTLTAGHSTGTNIIGWNGGGIRKITNQFGIGISCDSSMVLFAGDDINKMLNGRSITSGTTTEELVLSADGEIRIMPSQQSAYTAGNLITMSGGSVIATGNVTGYSDERIKSNIEKISNPLEKISKINGYTFERKDLKYKKDTGVLAQEIEKVLPEVITTVDVEDNEFIEDGKLKTVDYGKISGLLIECIKELKKEIDELKGQA